MSIRTLAAIALLVVSGIAGDAAFAQDIKMLVMPGRVIEGHADIEADCEGCHAESPDVAQQDLCTACHEDVGRDRESGSGFHGRFDAARRSECVVCHTDHEGRDADIVPVDAGLFDHDFSNFQLLGAHLSVTCGDCHAPDTKHRDAEPTCVGCHAGDDAHDGALGAVCQDCHIERTWHDTDFNHSLYGYDLTGGHADVGCVDCHRGNVYDGTPTQCASCHAIDDVHGGGNGQACFDCHSTSTWKSIGFDHAAETGFALDDGHGGLNCQDCHTREDYKDGLTSACAGCHLGEDDHQGRNGEVCADCHVPTRWSETIFDHGETGFALHDSHSGLTCTACHKDATAADLPLTCSGCHRFDDSHGGQMNQECDTCHIQTEWHASIAFDHDLSGFPLTGMHAVAPCASCHESNQFYDAPTDCAGCHASDDVHEGSLGAECGACHTSNHWTTTTFDHDTATAFPLEGGHAGVDCAGCHRDTASSLSDVPASCGGCHKPDDVHSGQFGLACDDCHNTVTFSEIERL